MGVQVLLLKQESKSYLRYEKYLGEQDYEIVLSKNLITDRQEILLGANSIGVVLILSDEGTELWERGKVLQKEFPMVCFIFYSLLPIVDRGVIEDGVLCKVVDQKFSKADFLNKLQNGVEMTAGMAKVSSAELGVPQIACLKDCFNTLELNYVVGQLLRYIMEIFQCVDVVWIKSDEFKKLVLRYRGELRRDDKYQSFDRIARIRSLNEPIEKKMIEIVSRFSSALDSKNLDIFVTPHTHELNGKTDVLYPILNQNGASALGYLLLNDPKVTEGGITIPQQVDKVLNPFVRHLEFALHVWNFKHETYKDDLTGLYNQKYMGMVMETEIEKARSEDQVFSVLFLDVDYFKHVNDTHGHWVGSQILMQLGKIFTKTVRSSDYSFRYGGDEYVILLVGTSKTGALATGERVRKAVEENHFLVDGLELRITVSIGLSSYPDDGLNFEQMIKVADQAMYYGKNKSRNIVYIAS